MAYIPSRLTCHSHPIILSYHVPTVSLARTHQYHHTEYLNEVEALDPTPSVFRSSVFRFSASTSTSTSLIEPTSAHLPFLLLDCRTRTWLKILLLLYSI